MTEKDRLDSSADRWGRIKDLFLLAFWGVVYLLKVMVELPWLWIKSRFKRNTSEKKNNLDKLSKGTYEGGHY